MLKFRLVDLFYFSLKQFLFLFNTHIWATLFHLYKRPLMSQLILILRFGALLGYQGPDAYIISNNLSFALFDLDIIKQKFNKDLLLGCVIYVTKKKPFISSLLGLVPKRYRGLWCIHHLLFPQRLFAMIIYAKK